MNVTDQPSERGAAPRARRWISAPWLAAVLAAVAGAALLLLAPTPADVPAAMTGGSLLVLAPAAFLAGVVSFLSPCTLPILPAYFAITFQARRERIVLTTLTFFLGLATTMVVLGATATALSRLVFRSLNTITVVGGLLIVAFGIMNFLGKGFSGAKLLGQRQASIAGSYVFGAAFALGWSACVGPILGALLTMLATQGLGVLQGALLSFIYALGIGTPLIIIAGFFKQLGNGSRYWRLLRGRAFELRLGFTTLYLHSTSMISGLLLIVMGALLASGQMAELTAWAQSTALSRWTSELEHALHQFFIAD